MSKHLPATQQKALTIRDYLFSDNIKNQLAVALPKWLSVDRFLRIAFTSIMKNPQLLDCTRESLLGAIMQCAQLGLEPVMNRAHLVPYKNHKKKNPNGNPIIECQFQPGYAGYVDLARRSGDISNITSHVIYEKDVFDIEYGTEERLYHKPYLNGDRGKPIGVYAVWFYKDGTKSPQFIPLQECYSQHRDRSQSYKSAIEKKHNNSPWITDESAMLKKTAVKVSSKLQSLSIEFMQAIELDNQAEIGQAQQGFFLEPSLSEDQKGLDFKPADFDVPKNIDQQQLNDFLELCANQFNRSINDIKAEAAEDPDAFWSAYHTWLKSQKQPKTDSPTEKSEPETKSQSDLLIASFSKLNKEPLQRFEKTHREEIPTWLQTVQDAFDEKWEAKMKQPYQVFLRRLEVINDKTKTTETPKADEGTIVCPATGEAKTYAACENECPGDLFETQTCLERFPE